VRALDLMHLDRSQFLDQCENVPKCCRRKRFGEVATSVATSDASTSDLMF